MTTAAAAPASAPKRPEAIGDRRLYRMGVIGGAVGAVVAFPFVAFHPHLPPGDATGVLETVLDFPLWLFLHFGLMIVLVMMLAGLGAFSRSMRNERAVAWADAAFVMGIIGTVFAILGQGVDGLGLHVIANVWENTPADEQFAAVTTAAGVMGVASGIFILVLLFYFGLTSFAYAWAFYLSDEYPNSLAALAAWGGLLGFVSGLFTYFDDFSDPVYFGLFIPSAVVFLLWVFWASIILWRRELRAPRAGPVSVEKAEDEPAPEVPAGTVTVVEAPGPTQVEEPAPSPIGAPTAVDEPQPQSPQGVTAEGDVLVEQQAGPNGPAPDAAPQPRET